MSRKIVLVAALVVGIVAAALTKIYLSAQEAEIAHEKAEFNRRYGSMEAVCFKNDVPAGAVLEKRDLGLKTVPELGLRGQAITLDEVDSIIGRKVAIAHTRGEVLMWGDLEGGDVRNQGLSADVKRQMRAISINCSGANAVAGNLRANDHVDVIGTFTFPAADGTVKNGDIVTCTLLQNVLVLAIGDATAKLGGTRAQGTTVTLEVSPREAEVIAFTEQMKGSIVLTLRNRSDASYEKELPQVNFERIKTEIEQLNLKRQQRLGH